MGVALRTVKPVKLADACRGCHPLFKQEMKSVSGAFAEGHVVSLSLWKLASQGWEDPLTSDGSGDFVFGEISL